jgi:hypothetical protein
MQTFRRFRNISQTWSSAGDCSHRFIPVITRHSSLITLTTSPDYVWIAETLIPTHVSLFHAILSLQNYDYLITYLIAICCYVDYLSRRSKIRKLKTESRKLDPLTTSSSEFHQVTPFSLFHCASNVPQNKKRQALSVKLTQRNKTEMAYQVMTDIAENRCTHRSIDQLTNRPTGSIIPSDFIDSCPSWRYRQLFWDSMSSFGRSRRRI